MRLRNKGMPIGESYSPYEDTYNVINVKHTSSNISTNNNSSSILELSMTSRNKLFLNALPSSLAPLQPTQSPTTTNNTSE